MRSSELDSLHDVLGGGQVIDGPRRRRAQPPPRISARGRRPKYAEYGESDIEDEDDKDGDEEEDEEDEEEEEEDDLTKAGAEPEGGTDDEDGDVEMEDAPMPPKAPKITLKPPAKTSIKPTPAPRLVVTPANVGNLRPVEDQEMEDDPGDDEVDGSSDLSNDDEEEDEEEDEDDEDEEDEEEGMQTTILEDAGGEAGVGGEGGQAEDEEMDEDDISSDDSSEDTPGSGAATPDPNKLTKRQRGQPEDSGSLMALDMAPQQRKVGATANLGQHANMLQFFTDAEKAMKKDEHARKRKELTKRKIQEEKNAALNRLVSPSIRIRFI